jgi:hypothetical protein
MIPVCKLVKINLAAQRVAMNAQQPGSARLIAVRPIQNPLDKFLFKFIHCFIEMDPTLDHQANQRFELILHRSTLRT